MNKAHKWITTLDMQPHPEGGYYSLEYTSPYHITGDTIGKDFQGDRPLSTSIYFLIEAHNVSNLHQLQADEIWYYHDGSPLVVAEITAQGVYKEHKLGTDIQNGERPQVCIPSGSIFGSYSLGDYSLVSCMVSYGFHFDDFKLFDRKTLINQYPEYTEIITKLTRK